MTNLHTDMRTPFWMQWLPDSFHPYIYLARYDRPSAIWILFFPCLWAFALAGMENVSRETFFLFFCGAILMRGAGCIMNDMADQNIDRHVERTRGRPLAKGSLNKFQALGFLALNLVLALWILMQFDARTILIGCLLMPLVILYPFMKRWTYWPQLFLGVTFNGGILMAWSAAGQDFSPGVWLLYLAAIVWTLGYDTIYGSQDLEDDLKLGMKSTAILFHVKQKLFLGACFSTMVGLFLALGLMHSFGWGYWAGLALLIFAFSAQIFRVQEGDKSTYLKVFKEQKYIGFLVFLMLVLGKI